MLVCISINWHSVYCIRYANWCWYMYVSIYTNMHPFVPIYIHQYTQMHQYTWKCTNYTKSTKYTQNCTKYVPICVIEYLAARIIRTFLFSEWTVLLVLMRDCVNMWLIQSATIYPRLKVTKSKWKEKLGDGLELSVFFLTHYALCKLHIGNLPQESS